MLTAVLIILPTAPTSGFIFLEFLVCHFYCYDSALIRAVFPDHASQVDGRQLYRLGRSTSSL